MVQTRRDVLRAGGGASVLALLAAVGLVMPGAALAADWNKSAFEAKTLSDAFKGLGAGAPANSPISS